jgi:four helix bundle protein
MTAPTILKSKSYKLALRITRLSQLLEARQREDVLSKLVLRSGTAVGALIREAEYARSKVGFRHKMRIALKEVNETYYWLSLLRDTDYLGQRQFEGLVRHCNEISSMLVSNIGAEG